MKLHEIAHSRSGDKGDTLNVSVIAYQAKHYSLLQKQLTAEVVKRCYEKLFVQEDGPLDIDVERFEVPNIHAVNFVLKGLLRGGVTRSLSLDAHGKTLASVILHREIDGDAA